MLDRGYNRTLAFDLFSAVATKDDEPADSLGLVSLEDITDRILDGQKASDRSQQAKNMRLGYMGHLSLIAEEVCKFGNRQPPESIDPVVFERIGRDEWVQYVEGTLAETRDKDNAVLGGVRPENAMVRPMGMGGGGAGLQGGGFSANTASALASAGIGTAMSEQDSLAMSEGTVGQSFEITGGSGSLLGGRFGDVDEDEDMDDQEGGGGAGAGGGSDDADQRRGSGGASHFSEDEQVGELSFDDVDMDYR